MDERKAEAKDEEKENKKVEEMDEW